jgi:hypothetical protein
MTKITTATQRQRTTVFLGEADRAIIHLIQRTLSELEVDNTSRAIRTALRYWASQHHQTDASLS